jgi:acyl-CoA thioester hydrolase
VSKHSSDFRIYYEDTDFSGSVYHANYLKFCERARSDIFFRKNKLPTSQNNGGFVVSELKSKFIFPAKFADEIRVITEIIETKKASVLLEQKIFLKNSDDVLLFEAEIKLAFVRDGKVAKFPEEFLEIFEFYR